MAVCVAVGIKELSRPKLCVSDKREKADVRGIFRADKNTRVVGSVCELCVRLHVCVRTCKWVCY